jgi:hypothetical protein
MERLVDERCDGRHRVVGRFGDGRHDAQQAAHKRPGRGPRCDQALRRQGGVRQDEEDREKDGDAHHQRYP